jgi:hypothetical protein
LNFFLSAILLKKKGRFIGPAIGGLPLALNFIAFLKPLDATGGIQHTPLAGKERVAIAANLDLEQLFRRASSEPVSAGANNFGIGIVLGMNLLFHITQPPGR